MFAAVLMHAAARLTETLGCALVAPADVTVVVPALAAWMVVSAVPVLRIVMHVPIPKLVVASVGMLPKISYRNFALQQLMKLILYAKKQFLQLPLPFHIGLNVNYLKLTITKNIVFRVYMKQLR